MWGSIKRARIASGLRGVAVRRLAARLIGSRILAPAVAAMALALAWAPTALAGSPILNTFTVTETGDASDAALADGPNVCDGPT